MVALVGLCGLSLGVFAWRMRPIAGNILHAKKDVGFSLAHVGRRVWEFFSEVICQSKVIKQRPLPGLAHGDRRGVLLRLRGVVGAAGGGVDCGIVCAAVFCAAAVAGQEGLD